MAWWTLLGIPLMFLVGMGIGRHYLVTDKAADQVTDGGRLIWPALAVMAVVRLWLAGAVEGYACDVHTFQAWAMRAGENLCGFYSGGFFADYPPGYMYALSAIGKLKSLLNLSDSGTSFL